MLRQGKPEEGVVGMCVAAAEPRLTEKCAGCVLSFVFFLVKVNMWIKI